MSDYNFSGLSSRSFEQMIQALSLKLLGPKTIIFGDGKDGGREATFEGSVPYPTDENNWNGYGVVQAKFLQRPGPTDEQGKWALSQLRSELEAFSDADKDRRKPEYYIFVTNAILSPVQDVGAKDKAKAVFEEFKDSVPLKEYDVWDYDKLRSFLDNNDEVRKKYAAFITTGDVLSRIMERMEFERPDFETTLTNFLEKELLRDQFANLEQAGHATNERIPIARVFTDLPVHPESLVEPPQEDRGTLAPGFVSSAVELAKERLNRSIAISEEARLELTDAKLGRLVLIGGPGQGKTTLGQFCCQLFRTALLKDRPAHLTTPPAREVVNGIISFCAREHIELPLARRFPLRIELSAFASALASKEQPDVKSLLTYIVEFIAKRTSLPLLTKDFREWLKDYPWLLILDGLDEVPSSTNRREVLEAIQDFWVDAAQLDADLLVLATTRPQGYNDDFSPRYYEHTWLTPLSNARALHYGELLADARYGNEPDRCTKVKDRLMRASEHPATARLMRSPLQVTIMATLVERMGTPPQERWQLFKSYYDIIFMREMEREIPASAILRDYRSDIDAIHNLVGLLLQIESERTGATEAKLEAEKFAEVVRARLENEGHEGVELEQLQNEIIDAATKRLVFLVGLQEDKVGFEIRSLQEFMASEALMDGKDETIRLRLRAIAVIANWRNVFLFAAGKCFAVQQALRDTIATIAAELNEKSEDRISIAVLAGSDLCLDLLAEGSSRRQPKYGRILARIALRVLELPPGEQQRQLSLLYDDQFEAIFRDEIIQALESSVPQHRLGAWVCVLNLSESGVQWAESLAERYWPNDDIEELIPAIPFIRFRSDRSPAAIQIVNALPRRSPSKIYTARHDMETLESLFQQSNAPPWVNALGMMLLRRIRGGNEIGIAAVPDADKTLTTSAALPIRLFNGPIHANYRRQVLPLLDMPSPVDGWLPVLEAIRFLNEPNKQTLAQTLRALATVPFEEAKPLVFRLPWPVAACLGVCESSKDIISIASRAEAGEFGDFQVWEQAEVRWLTHGVTCADFEYMNDLRVPWTDSISEIGFPLSDFTLTLSIASSDTLQANVAGLLQIYKQTKGTRARSLVSHVLLFAMNVLQLRKPGDTIEISASDFKQIVADAVNGGNRAWVSAIGAVDLNEPVTDDWVQALEFLGEQEGLIAGVPNAATARIVHRLFLNHPKRLGLMRVLAFTPTDIPSIPAEVIDPNQFDDEKYRMAATILNIKQLAVSQSHPASLASRTATLLEAYPELDVTSLRDLDKNRPTQAETNFWLDLIEELPSRRWNARQKLIARIRESVLSRTSGLDQPKVWKSLGLPTRLEEFFQSVVR